MGDEEGIEKLMATVAQQQASMKQQQDQIFGLVDTIKAMPGVSNPVSVTVNAPAVDAEVLRAQKVHNYPLWVCIYLHMRTVTNGAVQEYLMCYLLDLFIS